MKDFQDRYSSMFRGTTRDAENCPPAEWLAALAAGRAWPWRRRHLAEHLSHCSHCADDYRVLTTARGGLVSALEGQGNAGQDVAAGWLRPAGRNVLPDITLAFQRRHQAAARRC